MAKRKRRKFQPDQILSILKRHLVDKVPVSDLCDEYKIHPTDFYRWQKKLFEQGEQVFERTNGTDSEQRRLNQKVEALEAKLARKNEVMGELMEEHIKLKKDLGEL